MLKAALNEIIRELLLQRGERFKDFRTHSDLEVSLKSWFVLILAALILTDLAVVLDIPFVRPIFGFLFFTTIPGLLIIYTLRLPRIELVKTGVMAVGLSLLFLILAGLFFDIVYGAIGITNPLSVTYLLPSLSFVLLLLAIVAYRLNKTDRPFVTVPNLRSVNANGALPLLLIPTLFPFLAVVGTYVMNTQQDNSILIALLLLIPLYVVALVVLNGRRNIPQVTFPVTILMISGALLLGHGLTSDYLVGADVWGEYGAYQQVISSQHWTFISNQVLTATAGTSLLPAMYQLITGISGYHMFKLVFQLICSVTPLVVYIIARKYLSALYAFLASFLFVAQIQFIANIQSAIREEVALLFFALAFMVLLADDLRKEQRMLFFLSFASVSVLTHYTTALVLILVLFFAYVIATAVGAYYRFTRRDDAAKSIRPAATFTTIGLLFVIFFLWYNQLAQANNVIEFVRVTVSHFSEFYVADSRSAGVVAAAGQNIPTLARQVRAYTYDLLYIIIAIGVFTIFLKRESKQYGIRYAFLALAALFVVALWVAVPYLSTYGILRLFQLLLVLFAVAFVVGVGAILKTLKITRRRYCTAAVILILLMQYACSAQLLDQAFGTPASIDLNRSGAAYNTFYIYSQEVIAAQWLRNTTTQTHNATTDGEGGTIRLKLGGFGGNVTTFDKPLPDATYVYLYHAYLLGEFGFTNLSSTTGITTGYGYTSDLQISNFTSEKSLIYENGKAAIFG